jgi:DNA primase
VKQTIVEFLQDTLHLDMHVLSDKGWYRACCPVHEETRPSFGVMTQYPYAAKCFGCGYKGSLVNLVSRMLRISSEKAFALIHEQIDIKLEMPERRERRAEAVPTAVVEMFEECFDKSLADKYLKYRGMPKWAAKMWGLGYSDLDKALMIPLRGAESLKVQGYLSVQFRGSFEDVIKLKPEDAGEAVTVPRNFQTFTDAVIVEGWADAIKAGEALWKIGVRALPIAINTVFPTKAQLRFIRHFHKVYLGFDHDEAGRKGHDCMRRALRDKAYVFEFVYPEVLKDPGELSQDHEVQVKLLL